MRAGASLAHIRRYLGQVSDRMAEHYTKVTHSDLEDVQTPETRGSARTRPGVPSDAPRGPCGISPDASGGHQTCRRREPRMRRSPDPTSA
ncbi:hypothetical protein [Amycolatopsis balhimycina]|uniref:hypothetical protein n=1 Tax=Amycolatopsis balhimycina TaxID=208443 RepID=UPI001FE07EED|nr:hypothetical protein [Amycolatopsis balhimycina]